MPNKGEKYYNNGKVNIIVKDGEPIPEGFVRGMKKRDRESIEETNEKRKRTNLARYGVEAVFQSEDFKDKFKKTCLAKFGVESPLQSKEVREKIRKTNLDRYGVDVPYKSREIQEKGKRTNLERYGVENPAQSREVQEKMKRTNLERYGVESPLKSEEIKGKSRKTCLERYGVDNPSKSEKVKERVKCANLKKYGVEYSLQSEEVRSKIRYTNLKRYGVEVPFHSEEIKEKIRYTNLKRYGVENPSQSEEIKEKIKKTNLKRYGVENPFQSEEIRDKIRKTCLERYGVENPSQSGEFWDKFRDTSLSHYGVEYPSQSEEFKDKVKKTNLEKYGVPWACMRKEARAGRASNSFPNNKFTRLLDRVHIPYIREFNLESYSYDFKVGNFLIEVDPTITHNTEWSPFGNHSSRIYDSYHLMKTETANTYGFHCIHIFDWDDTKKIVRMLKGMDTTIYSDYEVCEVSSEDANKFLDRYYISNYYGEGTIRLGLLYRDKMACLMTFGKSYDSSYQYSLLTMCSRSKVLGGYDKLFSYFVDKFYPKSIISYCDKSKFLFQEGIYRKLGFYLKKSIEPSCHWYSLKDKTHVLGSYNKDYMIGKGYLPVYDCGKDIFVWYTKSITHD